MTDMSQARPHAEPAVLAYGYGGAEVGDYFALLKPRVMSLVVFTALVGLMIAPAPCIR